MDKEILTKLLEAGKIAAKARELAQKITILGATYLSVAEQVEEFIIKSGAKPAFPVNISVNDIAAHYTPIFNDTKTFQQGDLAKIDIGAQIDGYIADTTTQISIGENEENKKLMDAAQAALDSATQLAKPGIKLCEIGAAVQKAMSKFGAQPIVNLSGHSIEQYTLHAGLNIPNYDNHNNTLLEDDMVIAIEPFSTFGRGEIFEGSDTHIYALASPQQLRMGRDILDFVIKEYDALPFAKRWLIKKYGLAKTNLFINEALAKGVIIAYPVLKEKTKRKVAQAEHTIIVKDKPIITTK